MSAELWAVTDDDRSHSIDALEAAMVDRLPPFDLDAHLVHHFAPHVYVRQLTIPAGVLVTGKIHKTRHVSIISCGHVSVWTEQHGVEHFHGPYTFVSEPGTRRVVFAHDTTVWTTIHPTDETDLAKLEAELIAPHTNPLLPRAILELVR